MTLTLEKTDELRVKIHESYFAFIEMNLAVKYLLTLVLFCSYKKMPTRICNKRIS